MLVPAGASNSWLRLKHHAVAPEVGLNLITNNFFAIVSCTCRHRQPFYPRDAMLARVTIAMALCLCLCLSVTSRSSVETAKGIELVMAWELASAYTTVLERNSGISEKQWYFPLQNFVPNSGL